MMASKLGFGSFPTSYGRSRPSRDIPNKSLPADERKTNRPKRGYIKNGSGIDQMGIDLDSDSQKAIVITDYEMKELGQIRKDTEIHIHIEESHPKNPGLFNGS
jgi:hypothetical protein